MALGIDGLTFLGRPQHGDIVKLAHGVFGENVGAGVNFVQVLGPQNAFDQKLGFHIALDERMIHQLPKDGLHLSEKRRPVFWPDFGTFAGNSVKSGLDLPHGNVGSRSLRSVVALLCHQGSLKSPG